MEHEQEQNLLVTWNRVRFGEWNDTVNCSMDVAKRMSPPSSDHIIISNQITMLATSFLEGNLHQFWCVSWCLTIPLNCSKRPPLCSQLFMSLQFRCPLGSANLTWTTLKQVAFKPCAAYFISFLSRLQSHFLPYASECNDPIKNDPPIYSNKLARSRDIPRINTLRAPFGAAPLWIAREHGLQNHRDQGQGMERDAEGWMAPKGHLTFDDLTSLHPWFNSNFQNQL